MIYKKRGFLEICEELELNGKQYISDLRDIFRAMAHLYFTWPNFTGNLITLKQYTANINQYNTIEIVVGTMLLPYRACDNSIKKESRLLIPIISDPPVVGANQFHSGQYLLQMHLMEEFMNQSILLTTHGYIEINPDNAKFYLLFFIWSRLLIGNILSLVSLY